MKNYLKQFKHSFRFNKIYLLVLLLDLSFYILLFACLSIWSKAVEKWIPAMESLESISQAAAQTMVSNFIFSLITYTIILCLVVLIVYSFFKGGIWRIILKKRFTPSYFLKFALLNLVWFFIISLILTIIGLLTKTVTGTEFKLLIPLLALITLITTHPYFAAIVLLLIIHTTALLQIFFAQDPSIRAVKKTFRSFKKFDMFLIHYLFVLIPLIAITLIGYLLRYLPTALDSIISIIIIIAFITWLRFYVVDIVKTSLSNN